MFDGEARAAMEFYREVFGGTLVLGTVADFGHPDAPDADRVMHSRLDTPDGYTLMAWDRPTDRPGQAPYAPGNNVSVFIGGGGDDGPVLRERFARPAEGGTVTLPLERRSWGHVAGSLVDRFGIGWMFDIEG